jgi:hypothetical protein
VTDMPKLDSPLIRVVMDDGSVHEVQSINKDMLAWDRIRYRRKWPEAQEAMWIFMNFIAWNALTREGQIPAMTLDEFEERALEVRPKKEDGDEPGVGPTPSEAEVSF